MDLLAGHEGAVEAHLRSLGWLAAGEHVVSLASAGEGNMNRTLRARLGARSIVLKQAVPYVARYPSIPAPVERLDAEAAFYRLTAATTALSEHTPSLLGEDAANHLLCLEDLGEGGDLTRLYAERSDNAAHGPAPRRRRQLETLMHWLGTLHNLDLERVTLPACLRNRGMRSLNHEHIFEIPFAADTGVALSDPLADLQRDLAANAPLRARARSLGQIYLGAEAHASRATLLHGDYYPGSWLEHATMDVMIIDPEFTFVGPPEFDFGVCMAHLTLAGHDDPWHWLESYSQPPGFRRALAEGFAGMEIIRRLLGVAQLPLTADDHQRSRWLRDASAMVIA